MMKHAQELVNLHRLWEVNFSDKPPIAWLLRKQFSSNWVRVYSLPEGKRYADNQQEREEISQLHDDLFSIIVGNNSEECAFLSPVIDYGQKYENESRYKKSLLLNNGFNKFNRYTEEGDNIIVYYIFFQNKKELYHKILSLINDDKVMQSIVWDLKNNLICPYDGGVDIITSQKNKINQIRNKYRNLMSNQVSGL